MHPPEAQPGSDWNETYFDPEGIDSSQQFFSASLKSAAAQPRFAPHSANGRPPGVDQEPESAGSRAPHPSRASDFGREQSPSPPSEPKEESTPEAPAESRPDSDWRNIVSAKVKRYQRLRPSKPRYPSLELEFDFDSVSSSKAKSRIPPCGKTSMVMQPDPPPPPVASAPPVPPEPVREAAQVLEFRRPGMLPFNRDELAEPVVDGPRIVEAPELVPPPPALGGILIVPAPEPAPERSPGVDMPVRVAPLSLRALASAFDGIWVAIGLTIFLSVFWRFNPALPAAPRAAEFLALFTGILWFAYQSAFVIFCGTTPGLRAARLKLARFDGGPVPRNSRRWRVVASILSGISLGLGYAWCFFDEDRLSWHDRITKTHLALDD